MFYVYALLDPRKHNLPFYIGKGSGCRTHSTIRLARFQPFKNAIIKAIRSAGLEPDIEIIVEGVDENAAFEIEKHLILMYGRRGIDPAGQLTNRSTGGDGPLSGVPRSAEHCRKLSEAQKGRKFSDDTRQLMSEAQLRRFEDPNQRATCSQRNTPIEEIGRRISEARIEACKDPAVRERIGEATSRRLAKLSDEEKLAWSQKALVGRWKGRPDALALLDEHGSIQAVADHLGIKYDAAKARIRRERNRRKSS